MNWALDHSDHLPPAEELEPHWEAFYEQGRWGEVLQFCVCETMINEWKYILANLFFLLLLFK